MNWGEIQLVVRRLLALQAPTESWHMRESVDAGIYHGPAPVLPCACIQTKDFVYLVLCCAWLTCARAEHEWDVIDFFAGAARIAKHATRKKFRAAAYDILYSPPSKRRKSIWRPGRSAMDLNSDSGFALLTFPY